MVFRLMYGFMPMRTIEMVEMAFQKYFPQKAKNQKSGQICMQHSNLCNRSKFSIGHFWQTVQARTTKNKQTKVHSILIQKTYAFMDIQTIEMVQIMF